MADDLQSITIPPPTQGWNTKDPISAMDPSYAVEAINYFSDGGTVDIRKGYRYFAQNSGVGRFSSIFELAKQDGTRKLIGCASNSKTYNLTPGGTSIVDLSNAGARLQQETVSSVNYMNKIFMKDQFANPCYYWDGATASITAAAFTGPGGADTLLTNPNVYKSNLWFVGKDSSAWFTIAPQNITGALSQVNFAPFLTMGGKLLYAGATTKQGQVTDNYFAAISDQGEILLYEGSTPNSSDWGLLGHYYMPPPIGYRSFINFGADLLVITIGGIVRLSDVLNGATPLIPLSDKVNSQFIAAFALAQDPTASCGVYFPAGNMLIFNIALPLGVSEQYVMNVNTGSWWRWTLANVFHFCVYSNELYIATVPPSPSTNGVVCKAWNGYFDEDLATLNGTALSRTCKLRPAYNYLGERTTNKEFFFATPIVYESQGLNITVGADVDYANTTGAINMTDLTDTSYRLYQRPIDLTGSRLGKAVSLRLDDAVTTKQRSIQAIDIRYKDAGTIGEDII